MSENEANRPLRRGWTTGACATAATKAAAGALLGQGFADPVTITLPSGQKVAFALACEETGDGFARAGIIKDAGDDPDVTHGALVIATVRFGEKGSGTQFKAGAGVGTITKPGLPLPVGEAAINPVPRRMMRQALDEAGAPLDMIVEISIADGQTLAQKTLNGRLGILGGLSVLGTTGIVVPYSCAAWIASIHRGIDVARALGLRHVVGSTGDTSEKAAQAHYNLPEDALIDMGDFVGGMLKYLKQHPLPRVTIAGGPAKITKLAQGLLDLHSKRGQVDLGFLAGEAARLGADAALVSTVKDANSALEAFSLCAHLPLPQVIAEKARQVAAAFLHDTELNILMVGRDGAVLAETAFIPCP